MKKRLISLFVALTMLLCLIPAAFAATFNAGTYTASANGILILIKMQCSELNAEKDL